MMLSIKIEVDDYTWGKITPNHKSIHFYPLYLKVKITVNEIHRDFCRKKLPCAVTLRMAVAEECNIG